MWVPALQSAADRPVRLNQRSAFSLVELMVVIAVIVILAGLIAGVVVKAIDAFHRGDHAAVIKLLKPLRLVAHRFGGSHAQRDLVTLTLIEAAIRGGDTALARGLAAERADLKPRSPFTWILAARAAESAGEAATAAAARQRARSLAA